MKVISRTTPLNYFELKFPIWNGGKRVVGLNQTRIGFHNKIKITYKRKDGTESFPDDYYISGEKARSFPTQVLKGGVTVHLIPLSELEILAYE